MPKPLSPAMQRTYDALPLHYTTWGGRLMTSLPKGITRESLFALYRRGKATYSVRGTTFYWVAIK